jgi:hypothetical protein
MPRRRLTARERAKRRWQHAIAPGTRGATSLNTPDELAELEQRGAFASFGGPPVPRPGARRR